MKVHFMGIGGSGMSAAACLTKLSGYEVEGSDLQSDTPYIKKAKDLGIKTYVGHDTKQLDSVDVLSVSPAAFFREDTSFIDFAKEKGIEVMTWQAFMGKYLHKDKKVICMAGTHGKSTTTAMASLMFEGADLDPSVMIGATIHEWGSNYRFGNGEYFLVESDEFYDNFLNYSPDYIILNNIEYDHPDYFKSEKQLFESFERHIKNLKGEKILIVNVDDPGVNRILDSLDSEFLSGVNVVGYTISDSKCRHAGKVVSASIKSRGEEGTGFVVSGKKYTLKIPGDYNVSNALGLIALAQVLGIDYESVESSLAKFNGVGRRMDLIGEKDGVLIYEDYAHHPTALRLTLEALRQRYPKKKILAVYEPHSFSRTSALLEDYKRAFSDVDEAIITPIFKARDTEDYGVSNQSIVDISENKNVSAFDSFEGIVKYVGKNLKNWDVVVVMGAGKSYQLARSVLNPL